MKISPVSSLLILRYVPPLFLFFLPLFLLLATLNALASLENPAALSGARYLAFSHLSQAPAKTLNATSRSRLQRAGAGKKGGEHTKSWPRHSRYGKSQ